MGWAFRSRLTLLLALAIGLGGLPHAAEPKVFHSRAEGLELAFPDADRIDKQTLVLDKEQAAAIEALARSKLESRLVNVYTGYREDRVLGYALVDIHIVRTLPEAFLVKITPTGEVASLRILAFHEPQEYRPTSRWLAQFDNRSLTKDLRMHGEIQGISGATLSARAVTKGVRRALALYEIVLRDEAVAGGAEVSQAGG